jgi:hypothetical protein
MVRSTQPEVGWLVTKALAIENVPAEIGQECDDIMAALGRLAA